MVAENANNEEPPFTVVNNVLRGKVCPFEMKCSNIGAVLLDRMRANGHLIGQIDALTDAEDTYAEIADRSIKCALWLKEQGIGRGDVVALCSDNHLDAVIPCLAALYLGAIFNPWDYHMNASLARHSLSISEPKVIFVIERTAAVTLEAVRSQDRNIKIITFGEYPGTTAYADVLKGHSSSDVVNFQPVEIEDVNETGTILYSSGTTGLPKGVQLSYYTLMYNVEVTSAVLMAEEAPLWFSTLYWISGVLLSFLSIFNGFTRVVPPEFEEEIACKLIEKYKANWMFLSTCMANRLCKSGFIEKYDFSSLKTLFVGGASLKTEAQDDLRNALPTVAVLQGYGMTEVAGVVCTQKKSSPSGSCGCVVRNTEIKIVDPNTGVTLPVKKTGEICIKVPTITRGYYKNPEAMKGAVDAEGFLHSGDLGYWDESGEVFVVDRLKELIKFRGHQVAPSEIENLLILHPAVFEVAVVGVPHPTEDEHPIAFVTKTPGMKVTERELIDLVEKNLMEFCYLRAGVRFLDKLPHTPTGKIARRELRAMANPVAT